MSATADRDALLGAICRVFHGKEGPYDLAGPEQQRAWTAARELQRLGATPDDLEQASREYRRRYPTMPHTPKAVVGRFTELLWSPATYPVGEWKAPDRYVATPEERERARELIARTRARWMD